MPINQFCLFRRFLKLSPKFPIVWSGEQSSRFLLVTARKLSIMCRSRGRSCFETVDNLNSLRCGYFLNGPRKFSNNMMKIDDEMDYDSDAFLDNPTEVRDFSWKLLFSKNMSLVENRFHFSVFQIMYFYRFSVYIVKETNLQYF